MIHSFSRSPEKTNQKRGATPKAPYIGGCKRKARTPDAFRAFLVSRDTRCRFFRLAHEEQHVFAPFREPVSPFPRDGDSRDVGKNIACPAIPKRHGSRRSSATPVCILPLGEGLGWGNASLLLSSRRRNVEEKFSRSEREKDRIKGSLDKLEMTTMGGSR